MNKNERLENVLEDIQFRYETTCQTLENMCLSLQMRNSLEARAQAFKEAIRVIKAWKETE